MKPAKRSFNDRTPAAKPFARPDTVPRNTWSDTSPAQPDPMRARRASSLSMQFPLALASSA
jgi:hypothetical protein